MEAVGMSYWMWLTIGLILSAGEVFVGAFVLLVLGIGALITGGAVLLGLEGLGGQLIFFVVVTAITAGIVYRLNQHRGAPSIGQSAQYVGEVGMLVDMQDGSLTPTPKGKVRFQKPILGSDLWECRIADNAKGALLTIGTRVRVVAFEGSVAVIAPA